MVRTDASARSSPRLSPHLHGHLLRFDGAKIGPDTSVHAIGNAYSIVSGATRAGRG